MVQFLFSLESLMERILISWKIELRLSQKLGAYAVLQRALLPYEAPQGNRDFDFHYCMWSVFSRATVIYFTGDLH